MTVSKTKNRMLANIIYYLRIWHRTFPAGILLILLSVPLTILSIYYQIRIPQLLIKGIECGDSVQATLLAILYVFLIMTICKMLMEICRTKLMTRGSRPMMWLYSVPVHDKIFSMPYQQLISADVQNQIVKLESITTRGGDGGPIHFFGVNFSGFLIALTGMAVFTREIVHINPWLLLAMLMSTVLHLVYGIYAGKYTERNMRERSDSEKGTLHHQDCGGQALCQRHLPISLADTPEKTFPRLSRRTRFLFKKRVKCSGRFRVD